jgi:hypothetical protein
MVGRSSTSPSAPHSALEELSSPNQGPMDRTRSEAAEGVPSPAPQYYFIDFSKAERMPPIEIDSDRPHIPLAQQDVHDLGTLFAHLISTAPSNHLASTTPSNLSSTLSDHFTLLISAMTQGGFTADEARRLHEMISSKWREGWSFNWVGVGEETGAESGTSQSGDSRALFDLD